MADLPLKQDGSAILEKSRTGVDSSGLSLTKLEQKDNIIVERVVPEMSGTKKYVIYALGIFVCYFYFGILQEKITRGKYGSGDTFTCSTTLVFIMCFINAAFAQIMLRTFMKQGTDKTRPIYYSLSAISYLGAMVFSNMALRYVNYPTQVVGKSCKPIPAMVLGVLIGRKRYPMSKYIFVLLIVVGICLFMYKDKQGSSSESAQRGLGFGEILLILSLILDGVTAGFQDRMKAEYQTKSGHMMFNMNLWASGILLAAILATGEIWEFSAFVQKYPYLMADIAMFSVLSAIGQMFIFLMVSEFGPLPCSIVTTTRKFFTVLGSVILFGNSLSQRQWLGTAVVFIGLTLDSFYGKKSSPKKS